MSNLFENIERELKTQSRQCLPELKEIVKDTDNYYKEPNLISKPVLMLLIEKAVNKIAELQNKGMYYEMDAMDQLCEREFVFEDLVKESIEHCELFIGEIR